MPYFFWIHIFLWLVYSLLILQYRKWFLQLKPFVPDYTQTPKHSFSIIIPARNEQDVIGTCLQAILQNPYPTHLFEVIVIDDHSTDDTSLIVQQFQQTYSNITLITLKNELANNALNAYKKKAIELAVGRAKHNWIITTDADCIAPQQWLQNFDSYLQQNDVEFIAGPVVFTKSNTVLSMFQYIDFVSLQGITAASVSAGFHSMCNGANLAYSKKAFLAVNGFTGIDHVASGDDMLLMNKIKNKYPNKLGYIFSTQSIVATTPMPTWRSFFNQRIRWASKADKIKDKSILAVLVLVYFYNVSLFVMPFLGLYNCIWILYWLIAISIKTIVELSFAIPVGRFFGQSFVWWFPLLQPLHIAYTVWAGFLGKFGTYTWKGRAVK